MAELCPACRGRGRRLNIDQVTEIRRLYHERKKSCGWIAPRFEVSAVTIWSIVNNLTWKENPPHDPAA